MKDSTILPGDRVVYLRVNNRKKSHVAIVYVRKLETDRVQLGLSVRMPMDKFDKDIGTRMAKGRSFNIGGCLKAMSNEIIERNIEAFIFRVRAMFFDRQWEDTLYTDSKFMKYFYNEKNWCPGCKNLLDDCKCIVTPF